jgi:hypothetical protein
VSFKAVLNLGDKKEINVLECTFKFTQGVDHTGKVTSSPSGGTIKLIVESSGDTDLLSWMLGHDVTKNGTISFFKRDNESALKKLTFEDGICISYAETFSHAGEKPMLIDMTISARKIQVGTAKLENLWEAK